MVYETVRQQQNFSLLGSQTSQYREPLAQPAKELGLKNENVVNSAASSGKSTDAKSSLPLSADKNKDKIDDRRELPSVVAAQAKAKGLDGQEQTGSAKKHDGFTGTVPDCQCEACRSRRYQDGSDDGGVSFQSPTNIDPSAVPAKVRAHEMEHVRREQFKAKEDGRKVIYQSVQIKTAVCPECGKTYVSGGKTRTVTRPDLGDFRKLFSVGSDVEGEEFSSIA